MSDWGQLLGEFEAERQKGNPNFYDTVRRGHLINLFNYTGRNTIAYYSGFLSKPGIQLLSVNDEDMTGFMTAVHGLDKKKGLDLFLHTPGGSIAATECLVNYLHQMFGKDIRVVVPQLAMSAGTMIACCSKQILMGKQSSLGPIDPQIRDIPAQGVLDEFKRALDEMKNDPAAINVWRWIISQYHPTFLGQCQRAIDWTQKFVRDELKDVMFEGDPEAEEKAHKIVIGLSDADTHKSHDRHIPMAKCRELGLNILPLEEDKKLQDLVLTVHHCYSHVLMNTQAFKIIESHEGAAFMKNQAVQPNPIQMLQRMQQPQPMPEPAKKTN